MAMHVYARLSWADGVLFQCAVCGEIVYGSMGGTIEPRSVLLIHLAIT
jgi:hypothetical protein